MTGESLDDVRAELVDCRRCPRLVEWRERVARERRAAFAGEEYWGRPVPGFGDHEAPIAVVGLAPAAHGANRTGRMFTGDRSGDWLFRALHRAGLADRPSSDRRDDGLTLDGVFVTSAVHCAPPDNRPTAGEQNACSSWLVRELRALGPLRVVVALGGIGFGRVLRVADRLGWERPRPLPRFGHGTEVPLAGGPVLLGSYHPSQQNTFTGRLTEEMLDAVFVRATELSGVGPRER